MSNSSLEDIFGTNTDAEETGVWIDLDEDNSFLIRSYSAKAAVDLREKLTLPFQALLRAGGKIPDSKAEEINLKVLAGGILGGWKRKAKDGTDIPFSAEQAYEDMKRLPRFANWVAAQSLESQNYKDALNTESVGN